MLFFFHFLSTSQSPRISQFVIINVDPRKISVHRNGLFNFSTVLLFFVKIVTSVHYEISFPVISCHFNVVFFF